MNNPNQVKADVFNKQEKLINCLKKEKNVEIFNYLGNF